MCLLNQTMNAVVLRFLQIAVGAARRGRPLPNMARILLANIWETGAAKAYRPPAINSREGFCS
jgi:hypothetical protein